MCPCVPMLATASTQASPVQRHFLRTTPPVPSTSCTPHLQHTSGSYVLHLKYSNTPCIAHLQYSDTSHIPQLQDTSCKEQLIPGNAPPCVTGCLVPTAQISKVASPQVLSSAGSRDAQVVCEIPEVKFRAWRHQLHLPPLISFVTRFSSE